MKLNIPELSLVVLIGASGSGKSTFARKHFKPTESLSSDFCRGLVSDDENSQEASSDAFDVLHYIARKRLQRGNLTVIDATNVSEEGRKPLLALAKEYHALPVAIVFKLPEEVCLERNRARHDRDFGPHVVRRHTRQMRRSIPNLRREGFRYVYVLDTQEEIDAIEIVREPLWNDKRGEHGPFDIIGDVHGCIDELLALLSKLGYEVTALPTDDGVPAYSAQPPEGRRAIFLGDLVDRGPGTPQVLALAMDMVESGAAFAVPGNHDVKLARYLKGKNVQLKHGLAETIAQLVEHPQEFRGRVAAFLDGLVSHYVLDEGKLVVAHAGMKAEMQGRGSGAVREFALYGETTGERDEFGLPVRYDWASEYRGRAAVVYGHTPVPEPEWLNNTINIDTGCVFGGKLTALRYPEREMVSVPALHTYFESPKPFLLADAPVASAFTAQQMHDDVLDLGDLLGKRYITTRLQRNVLVREENGIAATEVLSRFAADPKWLIYLPPTMSPTETTHEEGLLEHPAEAFAYYRQEGVPFVVCEEKHMGSRAVVIACRDEDAARRRFGVVGEGSGIVYTRTGRRFFNDAALEAELLARVRGALDAAGLWDELKTDWVCLDCELMPWSAKAQELLRGQYAAVGASARASLSGAVASLQQAAGRDGGGGEGAGALLARFTGRAEMIEQYVEAYRHYCWPIESVGDLTLAPFHILAAEGHAYMDMDHTWHMETLAGVCRQDEVLLLVTPYRVVDLADDESQAGALRWWEELTARGGEGMVVKPLEFVARGPRGVVQPAIKCRGREYLRIIYGPEYTAPESLARLRHRRLATKRGLALREFALGVEALERFVGGEPLRRVHECVFGVLALESEPVDPRL